MEPIGNAIQKMDLPMELTSDFCMKHEIQSNGEVFIKKIQLIKYEGETFCPVCEREQNDLALQLEIQKRVAGAHSRKKYNVFEKQSILTDVNLLNASFTNYETCDPEEISNKDRATTAFKEYRDGNSFNTWLTGSPGVGKSHLAMSILRNLNESGEQNRSCLFVSVDEMLMRIRNSFNDRESKYTENYFVDLLTDVDFLVLDDLGAETGGTGTTKKATDFTLRVLYAIANGRQNKSTLVTTNLGRKDLVGMYDPKLVSRLMKNTYLIKFEETTDKRIKNINF